MALMDGGGAAAPDASGAIQSTTTTTRPASADSRPSQPKQQCGVTDPGSWFGARKRGAQDWLHQHRNDLRNVAKGAEAVAGVASAVGTGCAIVGAVTSATIVGGITGGSCAAVAFGVAGVASGVAAVANLGAKAGGADVSNVEVGLDVLGAVPGVGMLARGARAAKAAEDVTAGIKITDWSGYPSSLPKPSGPFRLLSGDEYDAARAAANSVNRALRKEAGGELTGMQIHEVQPVKWGGSPTDIANKLAIPENLHYEVTAWWNALQRSIEGGGV